MDRGLRRWALTRRRGVVPALWLFTDAVRLADPLAAAASLPRGRAGVVFRHDGAPGRAALGGALARLCRARRLMLVVAGDARLAAALGAGVHLRDGRWPDAARTRRGAMLTSSAHDAQAARRAVRAGARLVFLSPVFATASHPGAPALGPLRWAALARHAPGRAAALGGMTDRSVRRLARACRAVGAIGALAGPR